MKSLIEKNNVLKYSDSYDDGQGLYRLMLEKNLEGVVAKKRSSIYKPGHRGKNG